MRQLEEENNVRNGNRFVQVDLLSSSLWIAGMVSPRAGAFSSLFAVVFFTRIRVDSLSMESSLLQLDRIRVEDTGSPKSAEKKLWR